MAFALTVTAQSLMNKGELFIDALRLHCNIVNRGKIVARNATLKRTPGDAETLTLDNTEGIIDIQKRLVWQQGRVKNTRGKFCSETLRGNTTESSWRFAKQPWGYCSTFGGNG